MIYLDTHLVVWLYAGELTRLSKRCVELIETKDLVISPIVSLELQYLYEIERIKATSSKIITALKKELNLSVSTLPFIEVITAAVKEPWTRDPFDRIIVAQARMDQSPLLTKDQMIRENYKAAQW